MPPPLIAGRNTRQVHGRYAQRSLPTRPKSTPLMPEVLRGARGRALWTGSHEDGAVGFTPLTLAFKFFKHACDKLSAVERKSPEQPAQSPTAGAAAGNADAAPSSWLCCKRKTARGSTSEVGWPLRCCWLPLITTRCRLAVQGASLSVPCARGQQAKQCARRGSGTAGGAPQLGPPVTTKQRSARQRPGLPHRLRDRLANIDQLSAGPQWRTGVELRGGQEERQPDHRSALASG
jgi:hypothetical protein